MNKLATFVMAVTEKFGLTFQVPSRTIAQILGNISYVTVRKYLSMLETNGYLVCERPSRREGVVYKLKKHRIKRLIDNYRKCKEINQLFFNGKM